MTRLRLEFLSGPRRGDASVFSSSRVSLGRSRSNTFVLADTVAPAASGRHAEILLENGTWWLVDQNSTNGTFLNGTRVTRAAVSSGDRITVGDVELKVGFVDTAPASRSRPFALAALALTGLALAAAAYWALVLRPGLPQRVADVASGSVYLIALERGGARTIVGTAFAVTDDGLLATNAHVAAALEGRVVQGQSDSRALAIRGDSYDAHDVTSTTLHPAWAAGSVAHDVALIRLASPTRSVALPLATPAQVRNLQRGAALSTFGFPAVSTDVARPRGRLSVDVVADVRLPFLEVGLGVAPGTSGSPVFGPDGTVVALVVSGDFVAGPPGTAPRPSGTNANWAIAVDELRDLLSRSRDQ